MRKKVAILFDGPNYHRSLVEQGFRLDLDAFEKYCQEKLGDVVVKRYYASGGEVLDPKFVTVLISKEYEVVVTPQVDSQIIVDATNMIAKREANVIVLVSADGSYFPLIKYAYENGAKVVIAHDQSFRGFAMLLKEAIKRGMAEYMNIRELQRTEVQQ